MAQFDLVILGGGSGGYAEGFIDVSQLSQLTITVGARGNAGTSSSAPTNGGLSSINNIVIAGGGAAGGGGQSFGPGAGGSGGVSSGLNFYLLNGADGQSPNCNYTMPGIPKVTMSYPSTSSAEKAYGMGGGSTYNNFGGSGTSGYVIIQY